jgi:hypothetical protein
VRAGGTALQPAACSRARRRHSPAALSNPPAQPPSRPARTLTRLLPRSPAQAFSAETEQQLLQSGSETIVSVETLCIDAVRRRGLRQASGAVLVQTITIAGDSPFVVADVESIGELWPRACALARRGAARVLWSGAACALGRPVLWAGRCSGPACALAYFGRPVL